MRHLLVSLVLAVVAPLASAQEAVDPAAVAAAVKQGQAAVQEGNYDVAIASFRKATQLDPKNATAWHMLGYSLHGAGKLDEALPIHLKAAEFKAVAPVATYNVACVHALKGDKDKAIEWLQKAVALGFNDKTQLANDTDFASLKDDPRFQKLLNELGTTLQAYVVTTERRSARVAYFADQGSPGQLALDYGVVNWDDKYEQALGSPKFQGKKWRFGSDFWTTFDNSLPVTIGGVEIPAGYWYLTIRCEGEGKFVLGVHDPLAVKKQHIDPFRAEQVQGGIDVPLAHQKSESVHKQLEAGIELPAGEKQKGKLYVRFGPHELVAPVEIALPK